MKRIYALAFATALSAYAGQASATHKSWLLKNAAGDCDFGLNRADDTNNLALGAPLKNNIPLARDVVCPVALSARWGSSNYLPFSPPRWSDARSAVVYARFPSGGGTVSCRAAMQGTSGILYYGRTASVTATGGVQPIFAAEEGTWGAGTSLENNENLTAKSLDLVCTIPQGAGIYGFRAKICQTTGNCAAFTEPNSEYDFGGGVADSQIVQTSGIECAPSFPFVTATRSASGITPNGGGSVFCPIAPPSDDSREHERTMRFTTVRYSGGSYAQNCVTAGTCPQCQLRWWNKSGAATQSAFFTRDEFLPAERFVWQGRIVQNIGHETLVGVDCYVPSGITLQGVTAWSSTTAISAGI